MLKSKCFFSSLLKMPKPSIVIFVFYKDLATSFNTLNQTNFSTISYRLKKQRTNGCHKTKLESRHLVLIGETNEIWPHYTYWAYSKQLLLMLRLKKIFIDEAFFEGAICQDFRLTLSRVVRKRLRKCGSCHIESRNM